MNTADYPFIALRAKIQRLLYTFCYYLATPILLLRLLWRSRLNTHYRQRWRERLGYLSHLPLTKPVIWLHAVSVGEVLAAVPLIHALLQKYTQYVVVVTTTTPTGSALVKDKFKDAIVHCYLPYDLPHCQRRFLKYIRPCLGIIMETELWPNLLHLCWQQGIPLFLANGRLSAKSLAGYKKVASLTASTLACFSMVATQTSNDGDRFIQLGLPPARLRVLGNIKFDLDLPEEALARGRHLRHLWGISRPTFIAASTHAGEEKMVLEAYAHLLEQFPTLLLILVPRHLERAAEVSQICEQEGYRIARWSRHQPIADDATILLVDTIGELLMFYAAADVVFVGGSLVPVGGHNVIEPALLGRPILTGPHWHNFAQISQLLVIAQAMQVIHDVAGLVRCVSTCLSSPDLGHQMGLRGRDVALANRGALKKHLACIESWLE